MYLGLKDLPVEVRDILVRSYVLSADEDTGSGIFDNGASGAVNSVSSDTAFDDVVINTLPVPEDVLRKVDKSFENSRVRAKSKGEVYTPSWLCNLMNNMVDEKLLYKDVFNKVSGDGATWVPVSDPVVFGSEYSWVQYVSDRRLEVAAGEGPYIMSPYDAVSGAEIPLRDEHGVFQRIGFLDRKFRVIDENVGSSSEWLDYAYIALASCYGFEWQTDNLMIARLNFLNTFVDYYVDRFNALPEKDVFLTVAEIASWNLWWMDGSRLVIPDSCSAMCVSCERKLRTGHDGVKPVIRFLNDNNSFSVNSFEKLFQ